MCKENGLHNQLVGIIGLGIKSGLVVAGFQRVKKNLLRNNLGLVICSNDLSRNTRKQLLYYCNLNGILLVSKGSETEWKEKLKLNQRILGVKKGLFCNKIKKILGV